jgi:hypothetical protein
MAVPPSVILSAAKDDSRASGNASRGTPCVAREPGGPTYQMNMVSPVGVN